MAENLPPIEVPVSLSPATISSALEAPSWAVAANWPLIVAALAEFGIDSPLVQVAAAATIAVECPSWVPVQERHAKQERQPDLWKAQERYWPSGFHGRGFIQTTWRENYARLEKDLNLPLTTNPDLLLDPAVSARALAHFFKTNGVAPFANDRNWLKVRIRVNGVNRKTGLPNGLNEFLAAVHALMEVANA